MDQGGGVTRRLDKLPTSAIYAYPTENKRGGADRVAPAMDEYTQMVATMPHRAPLQDGYLANT